MKCKKDECNGEIIFTPISRPHRSVKKILSRQAVCEVCGKPYTLEYRLDEIKTKL
jgi:hypothetical protein